MRKANRESEAPDTLQGARWMGKLSAALGRHRPLLWITLGAIALRGLYLSQLWDRPDLCYPAVDAGYHAAWAKALLSGDFSDPPIAALPHSPYLRPPGYAFVLAAIYALFGESCIAPRVVQACLGVLNGLLGFVIGRRLGGATVGYVLALLISFYWGFVYFEGELLPPTWLTTLCLLWLCSLLSWSGVPRLREGAVAGGLLGLAALLRPNMLVCVVPTFGWALWSARRGAGAKGIRRFVLAFVLVLGLCVGAATARNRIASGQWVLISANAGVNLWIGNHLGASGLFVGALPELGPFGAMDEYPAVVARLSEQAGRVLTEAEASERLAARAFAFMGQHPGHFLRLLGKKLGHLLSRNEHGHNRVVAIDREQSIALRLLPGDFGAALSLSIAGVLIIAWQRRTRAPHHRDPPSLEGGALLLAFAACYGASFLPFFITAQYRIPLLVPMLAVGAAGLVEAARLWRQGRRVAVASAAVLAVLTYAASATLGQPVDRPRALASWHFDRALSLERAGRYGPATLDYRQAIAIDPGATMALHNLAALLERAGQLGRAEELLREALALQTPRRAEVRGALGTNLAHQGRFQEAMAEFRRALAERDDLPTVHVNLASILLSLGQRAEAAEHARAALRWNPRSRLARLLLSRATQSRRPD